MKRVSFSRSNDWWRHPRAWRPVIWKTGSGLDQIVAEAEVGRTKWQVRMNDFPDEPFHTLLIHDDEVLHFDDWPRHWSKPAMPPKVDWSNRTDRDAD